MTTSNLFCEFQTKSPNLQDKIMRYTYEFGTHHIHSQLEINDANDKIKILPQKNNAHKPNAHTRHNKFRHG